MSSDSIVRQQNWDDFVQIFLEIVEPTDPLGIALYVFISRVLVQFHLNGRYDAGYVLHETFLRAYEYIYNKDGYIRKPLPWVRATALRVVKELSRRERRTDSLEDKPGWEEVHHFIPTAEFHISREIALITLAFQRLLPQDQYILQLVVIDQRAYKEIQAIYQSQGQDITVPNLRQMKRRALRRLRDIYHQLAAQEDCCEHLAAPESAMTTLFPTD